jgi:hypothetical protein
MRRGWGRSAARAEPTASITASYHGATSGWRLWRPRSRRGDLPRGWDCCLMTAGLLSLDPFAVELRLAAASSGRRVASSFIGCRPSVITKEQINVDNLTAKLNTMGRHRFGAVTARVGGAATVAAAALVVRAAYGDPNAKSGQKDAVPFLVLVAAIAGDPRFPASEGCRTPRHVAGSADRHPVSSRHRLTRTCSSDQIDTLGNAGDELDRQRVSPANP